MKRHDAVAELRDRTPEGAVREAPDDGGQFAFEAGDRDPQVGRVPVLGEGPRTTFAGGEHRLQVDAAFERDERVVVGHAALREQLLNQADEPRVVPRDPGLGSEAQDIVVARVHDRRQATLLVHDRIEAEKDEPMDEVWAAAPFPLGDALQRGMVKAAVEQDRGRRTAALPRGRPNGGMAGE